MGLHVVADDLAALPDQGKEFVRAVEERLRKQVLLLAFLNDEGPPDVARASADTDSS